MTQVIQAFHKLTGWTLFQMGVEAVPIMVDHDKERLCETARKIFSMTADMSAEDFTLHSAVEFLTAKLPEGIDQALVADGRQGDHCLGEGMENAAARQDAARRGRLHAVGVEGELHPGLHRPGERPRRD